MNFEIIDINSTNLVKYGLFCKKSQKKEVGYKNKIEWIKERFKEGLKYKLLRIREQNKVSLGGFIEYIPGKYNWRGIAADDWMVIHCIWIVGKFKKKGYASRLLEECMKDAAEVGMQGIVCMTAEKGGWLPNKRLFEKHGFKKVDEFKPYFGLYAKALSDKARLPKFFPISNDKIKEYDTRVTVLYSHQCPYISRTIEEIRDFAETKALSFQAINLKSCKEAQQNQIHPYGTYCIFSDEKLLSYIPGERKRILDLLNEK
ncbi:MAG: GNAT family N-acetyltransferase [Candidatus Thorarchaeota archaeon]